MNAKVVLPYGTSLPTPLGRHVPGVYARPCSLATPAGDRLVTDAELPVFGDPAAFMRGYGHPPLDQLMAAFSQTVFR